MLPTQQLRQRSFLAANMVQSQKSFTGSVARGSVDCGNQAAVTPFARPSANAGLGDYDPLSTGDDSDNSPGGPKPRRNFSRHASGLGPQGGVSVSMEGGFVGVPGLSRQATQVRAWGSSGECGEWLVGWAGERVGRKVGRGGLVT